MRVTKTIREYIEKEVKIRLDPKYEAERKEAERQTKAKNEFLEGCQAAAEAASTGATVQTARPVYCPCWRACGCDCSDSDTIRQILPNPNFYGMSNHPLSKC